MQQPKRVIWIVYDSIRADHTSLSGYNRDTTPHLKRITSAPTGEAFQNAISHGIWSLPSSASMLTGTYPSYHNTGLQNEVLPNQIPTIPQRLSEHGWRTVGVSANSYFTSETGLDRGFDDFIRVRTAPLREANLLSTAGPWTLLKFIANLRRHSGGYTTDMRRHSSNYLVNEIIKRQLTRLYRTGDSFFLYAHLPGAHHPYAPPKPFRDQFFDSVDLPANAAEFALDHTTNIYDEIATGCKFTTKEWNAIRTAYDACIAHTDSIAGDLFEHIQTLADQNTVTVMTADHGDLLGEHDLLSHKLLVHDALVNVPLVVHGLPALVGQSEELIQHSDLMRTLLELIGVPTEGINGVDLTQSSRDIAISQRGNKSYTNTTEKLSDINPDFETEQFSDGLLTGIHTDQFKMVDQHGRRPLYKLPDESNDVSDRYPSHRDRLEGALDEWLAEHDERVHTAMSADFSSGAEQRLRDLGYVDDWS